MALKIKSEFNKNIIKLVSGTFIAQVIAILISPILTRLYCPEDFGLFTLIVSIFGTVALISGGRYELAILIPKSENEAFQLVRASFFVNLLFFVAFYFVLFILSFTIETNFGIWYYLLPIFTLIVAFTQILTSWFNRQKEYNAIVVNRVLISFTNNGIALFIGFIKLITNGLLLAFLLSNFLALLLLIKKASKEFIQQSKIVSDFSLQEILVKYKKFPLFNAMQGLLDSFQVNGIIYVIAILFDSYTVGLISLSIRILFMPMNFIGSSISQVFYQQINEFNNEGKALFPILKKTFLKSTLLALPILVVILFFGPFLFSFVFGKEWEIAGFFAQILAPWIILDFVRAPLSQIPLVLDKQKQLLIFSLISNVLIFSTIFIFSYQFEDIKMILIILASLQAIFILFLILWIFKITKMHDRKMGH